VVPRSVPRLFSFIDRTNHSRVRIRGYFVGLIPHLRFTQEPCHVGEGTERIVGMRRGNFVTAAMFGASLALVIPGLAEASTSVTVVTPGASSWTNPGPGALLTTDANCQAASFPGAGSW
jgi:hypothetical protein